MSLPSRPSIPIAFEQGRLSLGTGLHAELDAAEILVLLEHDAADRGLIGRDRRYRCAADQRRNDGRNASMFHDAFLSVIVLLVVVPRGRRASAASPGSARRIRGAG